MPACEDNLAPRAISMSPGPRVEVIDPPNACPAPLRQPSPRWKTGITNGRELRNPGTVEPRGTKLRWWKANTPNWERRPQQSRLRRRRNRGQATSGRGPGRLRGEWSVGGPIPGHESGPRQARCDLQPPQWQPVRGGREKKRGAVHSSVTLVKGAYRAAAGSWGTVSFALGASLGPFAGALRRVSHQPARAPCARIGLSGRLPLEPGVCRALAAFGRTAG